MFLRQFVLFFIFHCTRHETFFQLYPRNKVSCFFQAQGSNSFVFEIVGAVSGSSEYLAVAFASSNLMKDGDVYYCNGQAVQTGSMRQQHIAPVLDNPQPVSDEKNKLRMCIFAKVQGSFVFIWMLARLLSCSFFQWSPFTKASRCKTTVESSRFVATAFEKSSD